MNLDELVNSIPESDLRENLSHCVGEWKQDDKDIEVLTDLIRKWHGNVWFQEADASNKFHSEFQKFKSVAIDNIGGLTLNERLYWFGLFDAWGSGNETTQNRLRSKLRANA
ncbi:hypothetical protein [Microbulbifer hydrolyticus]|uniref:Phage protein n=1 Tax=Microbulbifer hydrolyticus TaxID=48074 RepID=A0A6P1TGU5_9GAMM|nr:hypothetical protein [Microbulbifer hydrolyticus]MBB5213105.1 hypothetical protein [Microbulbifer hydrolyticus]QHQ40459.1 hypothetical protein GTQ55_16740 [Microbulbifer hydrolyticus]